MAYMQTDDATLNASRSSQQALDGTVGNHIQIQMIYPQDSMAECLIRRQIASMSEMIQRNNKAILQLIEKSQLLETNLVEIEKAMSRAQEKQRHESEQMNDQERGRKSQPSILHFEKIFGRGPYKYSLVLADPLPKILYKERNFSLNVILVDLNSNLVCNTNLLPLSLCAYTSDPDPQILMDNKTGKSIFRGTYETHLRMGTATYNKIQFRQVSSYYKNGWIYFVIYPKPLPFSYKTEDSLFDNHVNWEQVRPLVIGEIVIKAKKKL